MHPPGPAGGGHPAANVDARTVFVRGVPYASTEAEVQAAFETVGPVRSAFLLQAKGAPQHKGAGFVTFALADDAARAVADLHGSQLGGRKLKVELALKRASFEERKNRRRDAVAAAHATDGVHAPAAGVASEPASAPPATPVARPLRPVDRAAVDAKHRLVRTVAVGNLTTDAVKPALALARTLPGFVSVQHPAPEAAVVTAHLRRDGCSGDVAFVTFDSVKAAMAAVARLHGAAVSSALSAPAAKGGKRAKGPEGDDVAAATVAGMLTTTVLWARQVSGEGALQKKWRVIVRNVAYGVDEVALRELLSPAGFVWELNLPRKPDGAPRGFAFASFTCRAHAERAIVLANAARLGGRVVAVDWAVGKAEFDKLTKQQQQLGGGASSGEAAATKASDAAEASDATGTDSDDGDDSASTASGGDDNGIEDGGDDAAAAASGAGGGEYGDSGTTVDIEAEKRLLSSVVDRLVAGGGVESDGASKSRAKDAKRGAEDAKQGAKDATGGTKGAAPAAAAKIAALPKPLAATKAAAAALEQTAGVDCTVFVRNLPLDASPGDVRVRMEAFGDVSAVRLVMDKHTGRPKGTAFVQFADASSAARAAAAGDKAESGDGPPVCVAGTAVSIARALTQDGARALAAARSEVGAKKDSRNLYLAKEGRIEEGSAAWHALSADDKVRRKRAAAEMRTKLKSPNFSVSRTRLCLRNLPYSVTEDGLKPLLLDAVRARATKATPRLVHVKLLTSPGKAGQDPKSKGLAFAEFSDHEHALCALRQLNNNPKPFGPDRRPIVEFAIEDARVLRKRAAWREAAKERAAAAKETAKSNGGGGGSGDRSAPGAGGSANVAGRHKRARHGDKDAPPPDKVGARVGPKAGAKVRTKAGDKVGPKAGANASVLPGNAGATAPPTPPGARASKAKRTGGGTARADGGPPAKRKGGDAAHGDGGPAAKRPRHKDAKAGPPPKQGAKVAPAVAAPPDRAPRLKRRGPNAHGGEEKQDRLDKLVAAYKAKLVSDAPTFDRWL